MYPSLAGATLNEPVRRNPERARPAVQPRASPAGVTLNKPGLRKLTPGKVGQPQRPGRRAVGKERWRAKRNAAAPLEEPCLKTVIVARGFFGSSNKSFITPGSTPTKISREYPKVPAAVERRVIIDDPNPIGPNKTRLPRTTA
jgi:hypothetical protein